MFVWFLRLVILVGNWRYLWLIRDRNYRISVIKLVQLIIQRVSSAVIKGAITIAFTVGFNFYLVAIFVLALIIFKITFLFLGVDTPPFYSLIWWLFTQIILFCLSSSLPTVNVFSFIRVLLITDIARWVNWAVLIVWLSFILSSLKNNVFRFVVLKRSGAILHDSAWVSMCAFFRALLNLFLNLFIITVSIINLRSGWIGSLFILKLIAFRLVFHLMLRIFWGEAIWTGAILLEESSILLFVFLNSSHHCLFDLNKTCTLGHSWIVLLYWFRLFGSLQNPLGLQSI